MPRPHKKRRICIKPGFTFFRPDGVEITEENTIELRLDELEAMRLANLEELYQEQGAEQMMTSRATFGRILDEARKKVTEALIFGKAIRIAGGNVEYCSRSGYVCKSCQNYCEAEESRAGKCPVCGGALGKAPCSEVAGAESADCDCSDKSDDQA